MLGLRMPWPSVPCHIWLPRPTGRDAHGDARPTYNTHPDIETTCLYAPGGSEPMTDDWEDELSPTGDVERMDFFLPKTLVADLRGARIAALPPDDPYVAEATYDVVGAPRSYPRAATPGDYSWRVQGVRTLG